MKFHSYKNAAQVPNIIVDGSATNNTLLTLSHWPKSNTPRALMADTSAEIVFKYLDSPIHQVRVDAVSNNHFDEDGLVGIYALLEPQLARQFRHMLIDVARSGDFGVYQERNAARISMTISAFSNPDTSPLESWIFDLSYPEQCAKFYENLLTVLPGMLKDINLYKEYWIDEDEKLKDTERKISDGIITINESPELDLAIIHIPEGSVEPHSFAIHSQTASSRIIFILGKKIYFYYRYESWVQFMSRIIPSRIDLTALADRLNQIENAPGRWSFDGVNAISPRLFLGDNLNTTISHEKIIEMILMELKTGKPAWFPFD